VRVQQSGKINEGVVRGCEDGEENQRKAFELEKSFVMRVQSFVHMG
jgi:hypothetical protein